MIVMHEHAEVACDQEWVIWNGTMGIAVTASVARIEHDFDGPHLWLAKPYEMVGPISLARLNAGECIAFEACVVMSHWRWQQDQTRLRQESHLRRREAQARMEAEFSRFWESSADAWQSRHEARDELRHRETLNLPPQGELTPAEIRTAYRRLAQKAHPDAGGNHEAFCRITEARDALLS